jgi:hypothetical protein
MTQYDIETQANRELTKLIVADIEQRTGIVLPNLSMAIVAVEDPERAARIYPILKEWLQKPLTRDVRLGIQDVFVSENASPYLHDMLDWMRAEPPHLFKGHIRTLVSRVMQPSQYEMVWRAVVEDGPHGDDYELLPKLAKCSAIRAEVIERILKDLESGQLNWWQLAQAAKVDDGRIRERILAKVDDPDAQIRRVARRLAAKQTALPNGFRRSATAPARQHELFSAEVDVGELGGVLKEMEVEFGVAVPKGCKSGRFTERMEVDEWVWIATDKPERQGLELWFRLEDIDVVEIVLVPASESSEEKEPEVRAN